MIKNRKKIRMKKYKRKMNTKRKKISNYKLKKIIKISNNIKSKKFQGLKRIKMNKIS